MNKFIPPQKEHLSDLIKFIVKDVMSAGGDGDAVWYSRYYSVFDLVPIVQDVLYDLKLPFRFCCDNIDDKTFVFSYGEEYFIITNDSELYDSEPDYTQLKIMT